MAKNKKGVLSVNSGHLRGRVLRFNDAAIRPTKAQVRKTLFSWLRPHIVGKRCLDCFTGSGILGVEAYSEGALSVVCLDHSKQVVYDLSKNLAHMNLTSIAALYWKFPDSLPVLGRFDIVFLDPPFGMINIHMVLTWLKNTACINEQSLVYVEMSAAEPLALPWGFQQYKQGRSSGVQFYLLTVCPGG